MALPGCDLTLGPKTETRLVVVKAGLPVEILDNRTLNCRVLAPEDGETHTVSQPCGGWIAMPPEHWDAVKAEIHRLRVKCGEEAAKISADPQPLKPGDM